MAHLKKLLLYKCFQKCILYKNRYNNVAFGDFFFHLKNVVHFLIDTVQIQFGACQKWKS